ncbi:MAG TPA: HAD family hydrolase [Bacteroidia bacterium]|nr:HAD family hydrolase [Bacteroidia bacterium]
MSLYAANLAFLLRRHNIAAEKLSAQLGISNLAHPLPDDFQRIAGNFSLTTDLLLGTDLESREAQRAKDIRLLVFDIDGVLTDAGMYYTESGDELKKFNAKDGLAIRHIRQRGIHTGIISHGFNTSLVTRRAERLHIGLVEISQAPKLETLSRWCAQLGITKQNVCFIGDDLNDEDVLRAAGFSACPADAVDAVKNMVHVVLGKKGGEGCVRELIDVYLQE